MELGVETQADVRAGQIPTGVHVNGPLFANLVDSIHLSPSCVAQVITESQGSYLVVGTNRGNVSSLALFLRDVELNLWKRVYFLIVGLPPLNLTDEIATWHFFCLSSPPVARTS